MVNYSQLNHRNFGRCCHTFCGFCAPFFQLFLKIIDGKFRRFSIKFARGHAFFAHTRGLLFVYVRFCPSFANFAISQASRPPAASISFLTSRTEAMASSSGATDRSFCPAIPQQSISARYNTRRATKYCRRCGCRRYIARQAPDGTHRRRSDTRSDRLHRL